MNKLNGTKLDLPSSCCEENSKSSSPFSDWSCMVEEEIHLVRHDMKLQLYKQSHAGKVTHITSIKDNNKVRQLKSEALRFYKVFPIETVLSSAMQSKGRYHVHEDCSKNKFTV